MLAVLRPQGEHQLTLAFCACFVASVQQCGYFPPQCGDLLADGLRVLFV
jgi:hypothetical protein